MTWRSRPPTTLLAALTLTLATLTGAAATTPAQAAASTTISIDGAKPGRVFDGIGAISGGGGNSRLLADYPEPQRGQVLDYLFKPGYGASLQILKVEIGGDTNSTDGAEASHMHTADTVDCNQGYEWTMMEQAKARNPDIKLAALSWGAPGWVNDNSTTSNTVYTPKMHDYLLSWLGCARQHNLTIDYLGGWNEHDADPQWYVGLKNKLVAGGYGSVKVVAPDQFGYRVVDQLTNDAAFRNAVDVVGVHYPCGYNSDFSNCKPAADSASIDKAQTLGKPIWASENGSEDYQNGASSVARGINRGYIDSRFTAFVNWPVVAALYGNLEFSTDGMALANQPWSGNYTIGKTAWVTAQTTQFTKPGWHYIDTASNYLGNKRTNGSYATLKSADNKAYSTVIETMDATAAQTVNFSVTGGLPTGRVHVWATNVRSNTSSDWFVQQADPSVTGGGRYSLTLQPGYVYTVTTTTGQGKGTAVSPPAGSLSLPYADAFETPAATTSPKYFADMNGAFKAVACGGGRTGTCLRQMAPTVPMRWTDEPFNSPYTIMGERSWQNYTVASDVMFEQPGTVELLGRIGQQGHNNNGLNAYHLRLSDTGTWSILKSDTSWNFTTLATGTTTAPGLNNWTGLAFTLQGSTLIASVGGQEVGRATDASFSTGLAGLGLGTGGYRTQQFDNFALTPGTAPPMPTGPITSGAAAGKCVDVDQDSSLNGARVQLWDCTGGSSQVWTLDGRNLTHNGKCLDVTGQATANGSPVELWDCNGGANQQWSPQPDGTLKGLQSGRCLDDPTFDTANGTRLDIWDCDGGPNQKWSLPA
ncbi:ricin-type beta-trefoil lectin domain protein [Kitasatospora sp. NPDC048239]|uniref:ricin-type beta-trefoil lectin domain protein n=1 Tax=Kitasatospora sp. NPDC048239 TaxID=3364046 RepID=UPI00371206EF